MIVRTKREEICENLSQNVQAWILHIGIVVIVCAPCVNAVLSAVKAQLRGSGYQSARISGIIESRGRADFHC